MTTLQARVEERLDAPVHEDVRSFARSLAADAGAVAALFYGSNLRTQSLDGVLDFYLLTPGAETARIWPIVSYHEREFGGVTLRAKVARMGLETFAQACSGELLDTTIWARFVQPSCLVWCADEAARKLVTDAIATAATTAARLAAALGPDSGLANDYWRALFQATYKAEFRVEKSGRENDILSVNERHFAGLLPLALTAGGIEFSLSGEQLTPSLTPAARTNITRWWSKRQRLGKPLNLLRLGKASTTFAGAARYAAWKIERHTGLELEVTPFKERYPLLAAPGVLWALLKHKRSQ